MLVNSTSPNWLRRHLISFSEVPCSLSLADGDMGVGGHHLVPVTKSPEVSRVRHLDSVLAYYLLAVYDFRDISKSWSLV